MVYQISNPRKTQTKRHRDAEAGAPEPEAGGAGAGAPEPEAGGAGAGTPEPDAGGAGAGGA